LLCARDDATVDAALAEFSTSLRPAGDYHDPIWFCRVYHYLGLVEAEDLLSAVYDEARQTHPIDYWRHVVQAVVDGLRYRTAYSPYLPTPANAVAFYQFADRGLFAQRAAVVEAVDSIYLRDADWAVHFWRPGAEALQHLAILPACSEVLVWSTIAAGLVCGAWLLWRDRRHRPAFVLHALVTAAVLGMIVFSALVLVFRSKELIAAHPLIVIATGLGARSVLVTVLHLRRRPAQ
jgi:hypothetical protein